MGSTFLMNAKGHSYIAVTYLKSTNPRSYIVTFAHKGHFNTMVDKKNIHIYNNIHVRCLFRVIIHTSVMMHVGMKNMGD